MFYHHAAFHLSLHCLPKYPFGGFHYTKGCGGMYSIGKYSVWLVTYFLRTSVCHQHSLISAIIASGLLIIFVNSLDPDQDRQNVGPDLVTNCLAL